jgi:FkbM family methyltransferase
MNIIKQIVSIITPKKIKTFFGNEAVKSFQQEQVFSTLSYAQEGEDLILNRFLENKSFGFYIDIGAHHPKRFSNTYLFYKKGWRGINIDAMPNSMTIFKKERPRDINLEIGVSNKAEELIYYMFNEPALNTFSKIEANKKNGLGTYKIIEKKTIKTFPLKDVISKHIELNQTIDFMTIDVEGLDLDVLKSNDWMKYRPNLLLVEDLKKQSLRNLYTESELFSYLHSLNYELVAKTFNTLFFKDKETK